MSTIDHQDLQELLPYQFNQPRLLKEALTHKSFVNESPVKGLKDNERMEFLGDAVLDLIISEYLFERMKEAHEGELSKIKANIVSEPTLSRISRSLNLGEFLYLGKGEEMTQGRSKASLLANTLEALIAAIYLDGGLEPSKQFIYRWFLGPVEDILSSQMTLDYKTDFQERCQKRFEILPEYKLVKTSGPDHEKTFEIELWVKGTLFGSGTGKTKKEAEQKAAKESLKRINEMGKNEV